MRTTLTYDSALNVGTVRWHFHWSGKYYVRMGGVKKKGFEEVPSSLRTSDYRLENSSEMLRAVFSRSLPRVKVLSACHYSAAAIPAPSTQPEIHFNKVQFLSTFSMMDRYSCQVRDKAYNAKTLWEAWPWATTVKPLQVKNAQSENHGFWNHKASYSTK